ncbi:MAG: ABC transporter substrate-binding protein [Gammaproteobacteria bacterium]|nr:ABC transporter substrate-binding protein [Gammaproteobacteria bacterium]
MNRLPILTCFLLLSAILSPVQAAAGLGPLERCKEDIGAILLVLGDSSLEREARWEKVSAILYERVDFRSMSQSVLAANWQTATPEEKEEFIDYFSQYLEEVYRQKIEAYSNQRVEYVHETIAEERAVVDTVIATESTRIPVSYKMKNNDGEWFIYDVVIEGLSLVNNYRSSFGDKIKTDGMEGLLADIRGQIEQYRADYLMQRQAAEPPNQ